MRVYRVLLGCAVSPIALAASLNAAGSAPTGLWLTAWEAPAHGSQGLYVGAQPPTASYTSGFADQTLRLIVTPHAAGTRARIVLSNSFGSGAITITAATIGLRLRGAALAPVTLRTLTFGGRRWIRIPRGQQALSDPAAIRVTPFRDLAVSLAFAARTGPPTYHYNGLQTSYLSPVGSGNRTASRGGGPFTATTPMRFFLTEVRVFGRSADKTLVAAG